jgi:gluconate 2-dehydrogenase gamma chain
MVRSHTLQGTFGDPYYGGNANFVGWDLIGYPGVRTVVTAEMTRLGAVVEPNHRSAYESDAFVKATAQAGSHGGHHGE